VWAHQLESRALRGFRRFWIVESSILKWTKTAKRLQNVHIHAEPAHAAAVKQHPHAF
jgi:hypothetical protein